MDNIGWLYFFYSPEHTPLQTTLSLENKNIYKTIHKQKLNLTALHSRKVTQNADTEGEQIFRNFIAVKTC